MAPPYSDGCLERRLRLLGKYLLWATRAEKQMLQVVLRPSTVLAAARGRSGH